MLPWNPLVIGAMVLCAVVLIRLLMSAEPTPPVGPSGVEVHATLAPSVRTQPIPPWNDPSIDAAALEKAFAPPPSDLPPEALPFESNIVPPADHLKALERSGDVAAY